ncbi:hypothetical protein BDP81DRAFT_23465 [Colletotrichum phormii]|uniref:Uncharacterized protein n=1 Tax=Colletotrichum phormii TaxID=359342 RepID=A0AAI9ZQS2_9PEZI|nr:uncharacterized protein BDP81DRAFT_23465 [Colletotrichum phormii]KAK1636492.1 hypothetical protein BDP81DRAFT_23465 [Colletotrichum phormii]
MASGNSCHSTDAVPLPCGWFRLPAAPCPPMQPPPTFIPDSLSSHTNKHSHHISYFTHTRTRTRTHVSHAAARGATHRADTTIHHQGKSAQTLVSSCIPTSYAFTTSNAAVRISHVPWCSRVPLFRSLPLPPRLPPSAAWPCSPDPSKQHHTCCRASSLPAWPHVFYHSTCSTQQLCSSIEATLPSDSQPSFTTLTVQFDLCTKLWLQLSQTMTSQSPYPNQIHRFRYSPLTASPVAKERPALPVLPPNPSLPLSDATCLAYEQEGLPPDSDQCAHWRALVSLPSGLSAPPHLSSAWPSLHVLPFLRYHAHQHQPVPRERPRLQPRSCPQYTSDTGRCSGVRRHQSRPTLMILAVWVMRDMQSNQP